MSRDIKFRFWDKNDRRMVPWEELLHYISTNGTPEGMQRIFDDGLQYTGLKDKNGVEIYEGDICKVSVWPQEGYQLRVVTYEAPSFYLAKRIEDKVDVDLFSTPGAHEEVIGNIYAKPELLESTT